MRVAKIGATLVFALTAFTATPLAQATPNDDTFFRLIDGYHVPLSHSQAYVIAQTSCEFLGEGYQPFAAIHNIRNDHPELSPSDVGHLLGAAMLAYCPQLKPNTS